MARLMAPRLDRITRVRNCAIVMVSSISSIERADMAISDRDAVSNASVITSTDSSASVALSDAIVAPPRTSPSQRLLPTNTIVRGCVRMR